MFLFWHYFRFSTENTMKVALFIYWEDANCFFILIRENDNERNLVTLKCILKKHVVIVRNFLIHTVNRLASTTRAQMSLFFNSTQLWDKLIEVVSCFLFVCFYNRRLHWRLHVDKGWAFLSKPWNKSSLELTKISDRLPWKILMTCYILVKI